MAKLERSLSRITTAKRISNSCKREKESKPTPCMASHMKRSNQGGRGSQRWEFRDEIYKRLPLLGGGIENGQTEGRRGAVSTMIAEAGGTPRPRPSLPLSRSYFG
ncbi:hypothetical protein H6P81_017718 [Aristolochia fimbriata]|uniref:Uncharacterized protein n=1 Tax=Aristolochia fimbriata TaxID=158543 RepID=A0AAV7E0S1_ARIFI|nr:hypothetical protein H6P81_017718 [Aristolochia fimbriata]